MAWLSLLAFTAATSITPGPNNALVAASAALHGVRPTLPLVAGVAVGFSLMVLVVGLGLAGILLAAPTVGVVLHWVSMGWLLLLAWRIATARTPDSGGPAVAPMGFLAAAAFQWVNPKAWLIAMGATAVFISPGAPLAPQLAVVAGLFLLVASPCLLLWAALGGLVGKMLGAGPRLRAFNVAMAVLMVGSMLPVAFAD